ncbi:hypothetical protein M434DRAFT_387396 [Hypoxylon sp. CO27-5]|nr:hypothetical protein M434DRAFT_387396 [Hypoxylon sp. CO27-5]
MGCTRVNYPDDCWNLTTPPELQAYGDISGLGVLISFLGSAWFAVLLLIVKYFLVFDPKVNPFQREANHTNENIGRKNINNKNNSDEENLQGSRTTSPETDWWRPNPIDTMLLGSIRPWVRFLNKKFPNIESVLDESLLNVCDVQVITGIGVLISGFFSLSCGLSAYHWQMIVSLAWFSSVTHLAGLTILRNHLRAHPWKRNIRFSLMFILLVGLIVSLVPTGYFTWKNPDPNGNSISSMANPAVCYFDVRIANHIRQAMSCDKSTTPTCDDENLELTSAFQIMIISIVLLAFGFFTRSTKIFRPLSSFMNIKLRQPLSHYYQEFLVRLISFIDRKQTGDQSPSMLKKTGILRIFLLWPLLALLVFFRLIADCFASMLAELYWLVVAMIWGTRGIANIRRNLETRNRLSDVLNEENQWTFGQILPVLLLVAPLFATVSLFFSNATKKELEPRHRSSYGTNRSMGSTAAQCRGNTSRNKPASKPITETPRGKDYPFDTTNSALANELALKYTNRPQRVLELLFIECMGFILCTSFAFLVIWDHPLTVGDDSPANLWLGIDGGGTLCLLFALNLYIFYFSITCQLYYELRTGGISMYYSGCLISFAICWIVFLSLAPFWENSPLPQSARPFVKMLAACGFLTGTYIFGGISLELWIIMREV